MIADPWVYVYALAASGLPTCFSIGSHALQTIAIGDIEVVVESLDGAPAPSEEALRDQHAVVVDLAHRVNALLPVRFGAIIRVSELEARLGQAGPALRGALDRVTDRAQMTVRVLDEAARTVARLSGLPSGTAYLKERRATAAQAEAHLLAVRRATGGFVVDEKVERGQGLAGTAIFHLVDRSTVDGYRHALDAARPAISPARLTVSGPWPPFAFTPEVL